MIPEQAKQFARACCQAFGERISSVILYGSFARGDQRPSSDLDLVVFVDVVDRVLLDDIGGIVESIETPNEINPAVISLSELSAFPDMFDWLAIKHDGVPVFGKMPDTVGGQTELDRAKQIAQEVLMSARHYLAVREPAENFAAGKLRHWNLKPLSFALRFFEFHKSGRYVRSANEIAELYPVLSVDPASDYRQIIDNCIDICEEILGA